MIRSFIVAATLAFSAATAAAQPADLPVPAAGAEVYAPFAPMVGKTWRGTGTGAAKVEDVQRWEWAVGGHAIRVVHAVNGGVYGGETLIFRDKDSEKFIFHYFTTGGFHSTGTITPVGPGEYDTEETVHGSAQVESLRATGRLGADGVYRVRALRPEGEKWVESGGFDYREDPAAVVRLPLAHPAEPPASAPAS